MHDQIMHGTLFNPFGCSRFRATSCTLRFFVLLKIRKHIFSKLNIILNNINSPAKHNLPPYRFKLGSLVMDLRRYFGEPRNNFHQHIPYFVYMTKRKCGKMKPTLTFIFINNPNALRPLQNLANRSFYRKKCGRYSLQILKGLVNIIRY